MQFRNYDSLRLFDEIADYGSFSDAAAAMHMTKGAISYQIKTLEESIGFKVFDRQPRGVSLTEKGAALRSAARRGFTAIEESLRVLSAPAPQIVTLGLSTYLASRWLSPRLMDFMRSHTDIRLRIQPLIDSIELNGEDVDLVIRWGDGSWRDMVVEPLFICPAFPTGSPDALAEIRSVGAERAFSTFTLLHDRQGSTAWADWFEAAGLEYQQQSEPLILPDPNVRVQAVIDGQGIALNDSLVDQELKDGRLARLATAQLDRYGYFLAYRSGALKKPGVAAFAEWLASLGS